VAGNTVVWQPAEYAAASARALFDLIQAAGLPDGVLNLVFADGPATFAGLEQALRDGTIDKIGFTGSTAVGARIGELAGRHLQAPCLELGGKNPMVVTPSTDIELATEGALFSGFGTAGSGARHWARSSSRIGPRRVHRRVRCGHRAATWATRPRTCSTGRCSTKGSPPGSRNTSAGSSRTTRCSARAG
jgi:hypothetical protein